MPPKFAPAPDRARSADSADGAHHAPVLLTPEQRASLTVAVVDDDPTLRESCASLLKVEGYAVSVFGRGEEALEAVRRRRFDILLLDLYMTGVSGLTLVREALAANPDAVPIVITGNPSLESSVEALRAGAWDYLPKPFSAHHLQILVGRAAHAALVARESRRLRAELEKEHGHSQKVTVLGVSPALRRVIELARKVAVTDASVFLSGESGTGKELIAQFIHHQSRRSSRPLVAINCAALPEGLLESEMFGHTKGAFTGAVRDKPGLLEVANGGTLFLDEITEMSQALQAKLLRVIQDGVVRRVGSTETDAVVNVRFIAATNRDPEEAVESGALRRDLYFRLRVVPIHVPPLRERPDDIPILARHFLLQYWQRHRGRDLPLPRLSPAAVRALQAHPWPGNVRELQNVLEHAVVLLEPGAEVRPEDIPFLDGHGAAAPLLSAPVQAPLSEEPYHEARERVVGEFERRYLLWLVAHAGGNMSKAARIAGVDRTTLYRLMEKHRLQKAGASLLEAGPAPGGSSDAAE